MTLVIENRLDLLDQMMADLSGYQGVLGPGPYWLKNQRTTLEWLRQQDLNHFRRFTREGKGLSNFGGGSLWRSQAEVARESSRIANGFIYRGAQKLGLRPLQSFYARRLRAMAAESNLALNGATWLCELCCRRDPASLLDRLEAGTDGQPEDIILMNGRRYTPTLLMKFLIYLDILDLSKTEQIDSYFEIGPGSGRLAEIVARLHPSARLYLVDIPPQLYVTHQVLHATFPGEVAPYHEVQTNPALASKQYRIFTLAPWQLEQFAPRDVDLAVCEATEEIPKHALQAYMGYVVRFGTRNVFIRTVLQKAGYDISSPADLLSWLTGYRLTKQVPVFDSNSPQLIDPSGDARALNANPAVHLLYQRT